MFRLFRKDQETEKYIDCIIKATGWSRRRTVAEVNGCKKLCDITYKDYDHYKFYKIPEEKQAEAYRKILDKREKEAQAREKHISHVMECTGWTHEEAAAKMKACKKLCGITYKDYDHCKFYKIPTEDQPARYEEILKKRKRDKERKERCIKNIMAATGWTRQETIERVKSSQAICGITYKDYDRQKFYELPIEEHQVAYAKLKEQRKAEQESRRESCVTKTMQKTGWSREETEAHINAAQELTGCKYVEYIMYRLYELTPEEQKHVCLISINADLIDKYTVNKEFAHMLDHKVKANQYFSEFLGRPWCVNTECTFEEFDRTFAKSNRVIYKPVMGSCGKGITFYDLTDDNRKAVWEEMRQLPEAVVEECVIQHHALSEMSPASVNTLRIVTVSSKTKPVTPDGKYVDIAYAALRVGGGTNGVDNFHSGGMAAVINLDTGCLATDAANNNGEIFICHPMTGKTFKGFQVPLFGKVIDFVMDLCAQEGVEGYFGWDIAITETQPVLIEVNSYPGVDLLQAPYSAEHKGMKYVLEKYL